MGWQRRGFGQWSANFCRLQTCSMKGAVCTQHNQLTEMSVDESEGAESAEADNAEPAYTSGAATGAETLTD